MSTTESTETTKFAEGLFSHRGDPQDLTKTMASKHQLHLFNEPRKPFQAASM